MALTLQALHDLQNDGNFKQRVTAACWKHAKTLLQLATPTPQQLTQSVELLAVEAPIRYTIGVAVLIDDGASGDAEIEAAVVAVATKLLAMIP